MCRSLVSKKMVIGVYITFLFVALWSCYFDTIALGVFLVCLLLWRLQIFFLVFFFSFIIGSIGFGLWFECINMALFSMVWKHIPLVWSLFNIWPPSIEDFGPSLHFFFFWISSLILGILVFLVLCFCSWWISHVDKLPSWMVKRCCASIMSDWELLMVKCCAV
jgi:hypothetical protein